MPNDAGLLGKMSDVFHLWAMTVLLFHIIFNGTCNGISGRTQIIFALVSLNRYVELFLGSVSDYVFMTKIIHLSVASTTIYLIYWQHRNTYDAENDTFMLPLVLMPSAALAVFFADRSDAPLEVFWNFSIFLETTAAIPQLYMIWKGGDTVATVVNYLWLLSAYRTFKTINDAQLVPEVEGRIGVRMSHPDLEGICGYVESLVLIAASMYATYVYLNRRWISPIDWASKDTKIIPVEVHI